MSATPQSLTVTGSRRRAEAVLELEYGSSVGRYAVLAEIGRGGMGVVLRGYDPRLRREVALKVVRPRLLSPDAQNRLIREARAMAQLSHPNVVAIYDVEVDEDGRVVVAMEYVRGTNLREWLDAARPWTEVVDHFIDAGRGLVAAHSVGLLHRDFKPANVLLGDDGRTRVADFGLARSVDPTATDAAEPPAPIDLESLASGPDLASVTEAGAVVGTLAYMAPEQHDSKALTAAVDQFAFCGSLWRGLTGSPPFDEHSATPLAEAKRAGPPPWPKGIEAPARLVAALQRGLHPKPEQRWPGMEALLTELSTARGRRRRVAQAVGVGALLVASATAVALAVTGGDSSTVCSHAESELSQAWSAERRDAMQAALLSSEVPYAARVSGQTVHALERYAADWIDTYTDACEATHVRGDQSPLLLDLRMHCLRRRSDAMTASVDLLSQHDAAIVDEAYKLVDRLPPLGPCSDIDALESRTPLPTDPHHKAAVERGSTQLAQARVLATAGQFERAREIADAVAGDVRGVGYPPIEAEATHLQGKLAGAQGDLKAAEELMKHALEIALAAGVRERALEAATELIYIVGSEQRRHDAAEAWVQVASGLLAGAGATDREHASFLNNRGSLRMSQMRGEEAAADYQQALGLFEMIRGAEHPENASIQANIAGALFELRLLEEAETHQRRAVATMTEAWGPEHPLVIRNRLNLGFVMIQQERHAEAETLVRQAVELSESKLGPTHPTSVNGRNYLALTLQGLDRNDEAIVVMKRGAKLLEEELGADDLEVARAHMNVSRALHRSGRAAEAIELARPALRTLESLGDDHPELAQQRRTLASFLRKQGREIEAMPLLNWVEDPERGPPDPAIRGTAAFELAQTLWQLGRDKARARSLAHTALDHYAAAGDSQAEQRKKVEAWLSTNRY